MDQEAPPSRDNDSASNKAPPAGLRKFWQELKHRKVMRVAIAYGAIAWLLIQVGATVAPFLGIPDWVVTALIFLVIVGFPISLVLSWVYELTPQGIRNTDNVREEQGELTDSSTIRTKQNLVLLLVAAAVPTLIFGAATLFFFLRAKTATDELILVTETQSALSEKSIAVLPFENRSAQKDDEYFTDGIHDTLINSLFSIRDLRTIARRSVMAFRGSEKRMNTIGKELGVKWLLDGAVQRGGDQIQINVSLIDAVTESQLWAQIYKRELNTENITYIQSEIVGLIANSLKAVISPEEQKRIEKVPTQSYTALDFYFKGRAEEPYGASAEKFKKAIEYYELALELDPDFALAHAGIGRVMVKLVVRGLPAVDQIPKAESHIRKAFELDDNLPSEDLVEIYFALARLKIRQHDRPGTIAAYEKTLEFDPDHLFAHYRLAGLASRYRSDAVRLYRKAYERDPKDLDIQSSLIRMLELSGEAEEAISLREKIAAEDPKRGQYSLGSLYHRLGRHDDAIIEMRQSIASEGAKRSDINLPFCYLSIGDVEKALWFLERIPKQMHSYQYVQWWISHIQGDEELRKSVALDIYAKDQRNPFALSDLTSIDLANGNAEAALSRLQQAYPKLSNPSSEEAIENAFAAISIAKVWMQLGNEDEARRLISRILIALKSNEKPYMGDTMRDLPYEALAHAISGDEAKMLEAIKRYFDAGGSPYSHIEPVEDFKPYVSLPEYEAIAAPRKAELAAQRERLRVMEVSGELPVLPIESEIGEGEKKDEG